LNTQPQITFADRVGCPANKKLSDEGIAAEI
jgi:hypothetical protein